MSLLSIGVPCAAELDVEIIGLAGPFAEGKKPTKLTASVRVNRNDVLTKDASTLLDVLQEKLTKKRDIIYYDYLLRDLVANMEAKSQVTVLFAEHSGESGYKYQFLKDAINFNSFKSIAADLALKKVRILAVFLSTEDVLGEGARTIGEKIISETMGSGTGSVKSESSSTPSLTKVLNSDDKRSSQTIDPKFTEISEKLSNIETSITLDPINKRLDEIQQSIFDLAKTSQLKEQFPKTIQVSKPNRNHTTKHSNIICDGCDGSIVGFRFNCIECEDFDLCQSCDDKEFENESHLKTHQVLRVYLDERPKPKAAFTFSFGGGSLAKWDERKKRATRFFSATEKEKENLPTASSNETPVDAAKSVFKNPYKVPERRSDNLFVWLADFKSLTLRVISKNDNLEIHFRVTFQTDRETIDLSRTTEGKQIDLSLPDYDGCFPEIETFYLFIRNGSNRYVYEPGFDPKTGLSLFGSRVVLLGDDEGIDDPDLVNPERYDKTEPKEGTRDTKESPKNMCFSPVEEPEPSISETVRAAFSFPVPEKAIEPESFPERSSGDRERTSVNAATKTQEEEQHHFEFLDFYSTQDSQDYALKVRSSIPKDSRDLIALTIVDDRERSTTADLAHKYDDIFIADVKDWGNSEYCPKICSITVHYKACDYEIFTSVPAKPIFPQPEDSSVKLWKSTTAESSRMIIPRIDSSIENGYVVVQPKEKYADGADEESEYSVLSSREASQ
jgi:hypothetical protein